MARTNAAGGGACSSGAWSNRLSSTCLDIFLTPRPPDRPAGLRPDTNLGFGAALGATGFTPVMHAQQYVKNCHGVEPANVP